MRRTITSASWPGVILGPAMVLVIASSGVPLLWRAGVTVVPAPTAAVATGRSPASRPSVRWRLSAMVKTSSRFHTCSCQMKNMNIARACKRRAGV